ncbi:DUF4192 domain-containing protein [Arthrobacter sp. zg-Y769]|uniref:DUF4192 domain-containing protein n=1 Tax=Arthrobacter sp. zg-Y769 TaxID=2894191 RepID=UPI001E60AA7F|nr:DUF4192 domain-containing protein [Arthrobacter sp. zg-Y769]MCC9205135.1 DUF4192 domain-containing protein [Arthrobacter sp. zg-Y769]
MSTEPAAGTPGNPYRVNAPADILSLVPHTLGFEPRNSLVLMALCGGRLGATLRLDLPPGQAARAGTAEYAATACRFLASDTGADGALLAMYTDAPWRDPAHPPYRQLVRRLEKELAAAGLPLQDGWLVGPDSWRDYFCTRPDCCPWPGMPRSQIADSMLNTELVYRGSAFAATLERAVGESFPGQWPNRDEVTQAQAHFAGQLAGHWCEREQFRCTLALWTECIAGSGHAAGAAPYADDLVAPEALSNDRPHRGAECAGFLLASLGDRGIRDALLVLAAVGEESAVRGAEANGLVRRQDHPLVLPGNAQPGAFIRGPGVVPLVPRPRRQSKAAADFRSILVGRGSGTPDWDLLDLAHAVFTDLVPVADGEAKAALLSLLAWMEWARGRGSRAHVYLQSALEACPGYRLALLLHELLGTGILPDWARSRDGSWPGIPGD